MKTFHCTCGHRVFFETVRCLGCDTFLGFDPVQREIVPLNAEHPLCANGANHRICNWIADPNSAGGLCCACAMNEIIPSLDGPDSKQLWARLEAAKRRLVYNLLSLGLPLAHAEVGSMRFRFMEDRRRNPNVLEEFIGTGHAAGTITINLLEADTLHRTAEREAMLERYRTLVGHFRHEAGHYYYSLLVGPDDLARWRQLFGDETRDYQQALAAYYRNGPPAEWFDSYVSAYATAHPLEDWAETFAHYLHIMDALETAREAGFAQMPDGGDATWISEWMRLSVTLNELNRSLGVEDAYPFVQTRRIVEKLDFTARLVRRPGESVARGSAGEGVLQTPP